MYRERENAVFCGRCVLPCMRGVDGVPPAAAPPAAPEPGSPSRVVSQNSGERAMAPRHSLVHAGFLLQAYPCPHIPWDGGRLILHVFMCLGPAMLHGS